MQKIVYQQGDVILRKKQDLTLAQEAIEQNHLVLAEGESTGHKHQIINGLAKLFLIEKIYYLQVISHSAILGHEEHKPIELEQGIYEISFVREYDHFLEEARQIQD